MSEMYSRNDWNDFVHTGPGTLAGNYLRMFWQPIYRSSELPPGRGKPVRIMSQDFALYRGEGGEPHLLDPTCPHRLTRLSTGWVEGDNIRCLYHGWTYAPDGQCIEQPAEPRPFCEKIRVRSYPVREYLGVVWAYLGEGATPDFPTYPELEAEGVIEVQRYVRDVNYFQDMENDPAHGAFIHRRGRGPKPVPQVWADESTWGMTEYTRYEGSDVIRRREYGMPNVRIDKTTPIDDESGWRDTLQVYVPIDDEHLVSFRIHLIHVTGAEAERFLARRSAWWAAGGQEHAIDLAYKVLDGDLYIEDLYRLPNAKLVHWATVEDDITQIGQGPIVDRSKERLGQSDVSIILWRKLWVRELRALAEGKPLKEWRRTEDLTTTEGIGVSYGEVAAV